MHFLTPELSARQLRDQRVIKHARQAIYIVCVLNASIQQRQKLYNAVERVFVAMQTVLYTYTANMPRRYH